MFCYLDNNATTRIDPRVLQAMLPFLTDQWGNPSSAYAFGRQVARHVNLAHEKVATLIGSDPKEVIFTSCGTESNNAAWRSALLQDPAKRHILTTSVEHSANIGHAKTLRRRGYDLTLLPVEPDGSLDLCLLSESIRPDTALVSVMWANNETGVLFPIEEIAALCRARGVAVHTDAVQIPGKLPIDVTRLGVDYLSLSAHKLHAPKGIGLLYVRRGLRFHPSIIGGHQEQERRAGTENVAGMVAFGRAAELAMASLDDENQRVRALRDQLERRILGEIPGTSRNGAVEPRLPNTANIAFSGVEAEAVLMALDEVGICASSGSACTTGSLQPSHVLTAMGLDMDLAKGSLRFSLSTDNAAEDVDYLMQHLPGIVQRLRSMEPPAAPEPTPARKAISA